MLMIWCHLIKFIYHISIFENLGMATARLRPFMRLHIGPFLEENGGKSLIHLV